MQPRELIDFLGKIEKLKCVTRHSWTSTGRHESVAEHSWRLAVTAMLCKDEYPEIDIDKVIKMCLIHDFGEAVTGDIPAFYKTQSHETEVDLATEALCKALPEPYSTEFLCLFSEIKEMKTDEARLFKALDNMETVISHNEAEISTWLPLEYKENLVYGEENVKWSEWTRKLKAEINHDSLKKLQESK